MTTAKSILCRLGIHHWEDQRNDEGQKYVVSRRCGKDSSKMSILDPRGWGGA